MSYRYRVYIIDLKKSVLKHQRFLARNPNYLQGKPCVYVGSTGISIDVRFKQHVCGKQSKTGRDLSNKYAKKFGKRLRHNDMKKIRPRKTRTSIEKKEAQVAKELQLRGWAVWWG
jgi:hypothetical protein